MDVLKYLPALSVFFAAVLCLIGLIKWRDFEFNRLFNNYSKRSSFAYDMLEKTGCQDFKTLGYEFGVAAFTGDASLTSAQRHRILAVSDPVRSIQLFKKCKQFIMVQEKGITLFEWKTARYKKECYRNIWKWGCFAFYFISMMSIICVPIYVSAFHPPIVDSMLQLSTVKTVVMLVILFGEVFLLGVLSLSKGAKIALAEGLINENVKASDVILSGFSG